ncbi:Uncharacterized protein DAT39_010630, partial [Clarias magur]
MGREINQGLRAGEGVESALKLRAFTIPRDDREKMAHISLLNSLLSITGHE